VVTRVDRLARSIRDLQNLVHNSGGLVRITGWLGSEVAGTLTRQCDATCLASLAGSPVGLLRAEAAYLLPETSVA
jgi:hypothetical protein